MTVAVTGPCWQCAALAGRLKDTVVHKYLSSGDYLPVAVSWRGQGQGQIIAQVTETVNTAGSGGQW